MSTTISRKGQHHHHHVLHAVPQFPACVSEVLAQITLFAKQHGTKWARVKGSDLQSRIDSELFCLGADRRYCRLSELQKFKLLGMLCTYFSKEEMKNRSTRHLHFDIIFCGREGETLLHETRINFLMKLCVMAVQYPVYELFEDVSQWLFKIGSGKLYAEKLIDELVDKFIFVPEMYKMYEFLFPLRTTTISFAFIFLVFSVTENSLCTSLMTVLSEWLSTDFDRFLAFFSSSNNHQFVEIFANKTFGLLLRYDCENSCCDEVYCRLHYAVTLILTRWPSITSATVLKSSPVGSVQSSSGRSGNISAKPQISLDCKILIEIMQNYEKLATIAQERFLNDLENALRTDRMKFHEIQPKISDELLSCPEFLERFMSFYGETPVK